MIYNPAMDPLALMFGQLDRDGHANLLRVLPRRLRFIVIDGYLECRNEMIGA